ncbi:MAP/microtubule affinity-regulating kinase 3 [Nowakowskiella sp. JEL0407]|nr:MAP/microtubule affinity-regulating kinase 3 [Nowakowskiella sp. JEL0407]
MIASIFRSIFRANRALKGIQQTPNTLTTGSQQISQQRISATTVLIGTASVALGAQINVGIANKFVDMSTTQKPSSSRTRRDKDDTGNPDLNIAAIGNYVFQKTVGEGNFAKVKLASHKLTGAEVAVKVIDKTTLDEKKLSKLYREVRIMKMLHHPNIVKLYEVIETKHTMFLIMEYASGGELYDYLVVHGKMKEKEARAKFRQILSAVSYCHKKRVIHRDLKAENLLLDVNLDIKIADFGFSNMFDPDSKLDTFCGSPPYAAPELFQGRRYTGPEVDIWSLGVILYVLTTGCLPFDGKNLQEMRESVCRGKYRIPFYLSDSCEKLLRKFLIRDPYKRASLDMLIDDPWINESYDNSPIFVDVSQRVEEDETIIKLMEAKFKIDKEALLKGLRENVYDDTTAIYYLLYHEKDTRSQLAAEVALATSGPRPAVTEQSRAKDKEQKVTPTMGAIDEDGVAQEATEGVAPLTRPQQKAKPKKRRFTVGGEAEVAKLADEDPEAAELLKKVQNQPNKDDTAKPSVGNAIPARNETTAIPQSTMMVPQPPSHQAPQNVPASVLTISNSPNDHNVTGGGAPAGSDDGTTNGGTSQRKRHNTIVGILRSHIRRQSEFSNGMTPISPSADKGGDTLGSQATNGTANNADSPQTASRNSTTSTPASDENKPRSLRFTFNSNTTSSRPPDEIVQEVTNVCTKNGISYKIPSRFLIECVWTNPVAGKDGVKFEIEICKLPRLKNLHGLRFKRVGGSSTDYKDICEKILQEVAL